MSRPRRNRAGTLPSRSSHSAMPRLYLRSTAPPTRRAARLLLDPERFRRKWRWFAGPRRRSPTPSKEKWLKYFSNCVPPSFLLVSQSNTEECQVSPGPQEISGPTGGLRIALILMWNRLRDIQTPPARLVNTITGRWPLKEKLNAGNGMRARAVSARNFANQDFWDFGISSF